MSDLRQLPLMTPYREVQNDEKEDKRKKYELEQTMHEATAQLKQIHKLSSQLDKQSQQLSKEIIHKNKVSVVLN